MVSAASAALLMFKTKTILIIIVISSLLTAVGALTGGFPLRFLEPVFCIQMVGAVCSPFAVNWLSLLVDFAFWTVVATIGFTGLRVILGAKDKKAETRQNSENEKKSLQRQPLPKRASPLKLLAASKNKLLVIGIVVTILLVLATGITGYLVYRNYQFKKQLIIPEPMSSPQPTQLPVEPGPTASWETYTNEILGFSIRHPSELTLWKEDWEIVTNGIQKMWWAVWRDTNYEINIIIENDPTIKMLTAGEEGSPAEKEEPLTEQNLRNLCAHMETKDLIFQSRPAVRCENKFLNVDKTGGSLNYYILDGGRSVRLWGGSFDLDKIDFPFIDQIFSTFKFLDQTQLDETAGWETYSSAEWGISFKYKGDGEVKEGIVNNPGASGSTARYASYIDAPKTSGSGGIKIYWELRANQEGMGLNEFYDEHFYRDYKFNDPDNQNRLERNYKINSLVAIREDINAGPQGTANTVIYFQDSKNRIYRIVLFHFLEDEKMKIAEEIIRTIKVD